MKYAIIGLLMAQYRSARSVVELLNCQQARGSEQVRLSVATVPVEVVGDFNCLWQKSNWQHSIWQDIGQRYTG